MRRIIRALGTGMLLCGLGAAHPVIAAESLSVAEVKQVLAQAIQEAQARGAPASIAVVDRVGNALALYTMSGANTQLDGSASDCPSGCVKITSGDASKGGLEGTFVPGRVAALAKAVTGAYLSSRGNAFTTRTASQIIQDHFNPRERFAPSGPLFGVQLSQLPCSDLVIATNSAAVTVGPKRSPLGLAGDPGGIPLYKNNEPVGAIGVISDGIYSVDLNVGDVDSDNDELIAVAGTVGFEAPVDIRGNRITVEGKTFRFTDRGTESLRSTPNAAPSFDSLSASVGSLLTLNTYFDGTIRSGTAFGDAASGYRQDTSGVFGSLDAYVLVDTANQARFAPKAGTEGTADALTAVEVQAILRNALSIAFRARAQIRRPLGSHAQVTISVVDTNGDILGIVRTPDGPVFGTDVSLQKARTAAFFSSTTAATELISGGLATYVSAAQAFIGPTALTDGTAFADRSGGNLSRPYFPDGIDGAANGPFSQPISLWSPFNTGLQLDAIAANVVTHRSFLLGTSAVDTAQNCSNLPLQAETGKSRMANGFQIFPGSVPIYRGATLVGGIGVSGDGVDQDDMISFLGLHNAGIELGTGVGNAPKGIRADNLVPQGTRLRYVSCPFAPFLDSGEQTPCNGK
ncbi:heme-binding protein [Nisaea acidiphila]|uniref:Heme-binding protein n=1 Tax=Nisaea acidiphila TaxID=1862145 RepID=A0A9J7ATE6_9PROT|nr:heme-binding protein [Nisaea acidiphila]UUX48637.1 heme-binding protein [Nisaea acidiphila]